MMRRKNFIYRVFLLYFFNVQVSTNYEAWNKIKKYVSNKEKKTSTETVPEKAQALNNYPVFKSTDSSFCFLTLLLSPSFNFLTSEFLFFLKK